MIDMDQLRNAELRDAHRLTEHALSVVSLGGMFSPESLMAAAKYCDEQAATCTEDGERAIFHAIAAYYRTQAQE